jgi:hypothetical protein
MVYYKKERGLERFRIKDGQTSKLKQKALDPRAIQSLITQYPT